MKRSHGFQVLAVIGIIKIPVSIYNIHFSQFVDNDR